MQVSQGGGNLTCVWLCASALLAIRSDIHRCPWAANLGPECLCVLAIGPVCASAGIFWEVTGINSALGPITAACPGDGKGRGRRAAALSPAGAGPGWDSGRRQTARSCQKRWGVYWSRRTGRERGDGKPSKSDREREWSRNNNANKEKIERLQTENKAMCNETGEI